MWRHWILCWLVFGGLFWSPSVEAAEIPADISETPADRAGVYRLKEWTPEERVSFGRWMFPAGMFIGFVGVGSGLVVSTATHPIVGPSVWGVSVLPATWGAWGLRTGVRDLLLWETGDQLDRLWTNYTLANFQLWFGGAMGLVGVSLIDVSLNSYSQGLLISGYIACAISLWMGWAGYFRIKWVYRNLSDRLTPPSASSRPSQSPKITFSGFIPVVNPQNRELGLGLQLTF